MSTKNILIVLFAVLVTGGVFYFSSGRGPGGSASSPLHAQLAEAYQKIPTDAGKANFLKQSKNLTVAVDPELLELDSQIISCAPNIDDLLTKTPTTGGSCVAGPSVLATTTGMFLGGQCCGTLTDLTAYHENLQKLQEYKDMPNIVLDPMHTPIRVAQMWIAYDKATTLTASQQNVYDQAYAISKEKPCCCKCWHYFTNEGIAKKMIVDGTYTAQQIADYWDASEICGV